MQKENLALKNTDNIDAVYKEMQESGKQTRKVRKRKKVDDYTSGSGLSTAADEKESGESSHDGSLESDFDTPETSLSSNYAFPKYYN